MGLLHRRADRTKMHGRASIVATPRHPRQMLPRIEGRCTNEQKPAFPAATPTRSSE